MEEVKEVVISKRFVENGEPLPFKIRVISQEMNEQMLKQCSKPVKRNGTVIGEELDRQKYAKMLVLTCTVYPNFKDAELCDYYKTKDPMDVPSRMLTAGEYSKLAQAIQSFNGFAEDTDELIEEAKN